jgi:hypothetical protein
MNTGGSFGVFDYIVAIAIVGLLVRAVLVERIRANQLREYAQANGLTYIGGALPGSFPLSETSVHWTGSVRNAVVGDKSGKELVIFDCGMGSGKAKYSQTVVAIRGPADCFGPARFGPDLTTECVREWTLLSRPQRLMPVEEINAVLSDS